MCIQSKRFKDFNEGQAKILFVLAIISSFVSSFAFALNSVMRHFNCDIKIASIITSVEFWLFLIFEIALLILLSQKIKSEPTSCELKAPKKYRIMVFSIFLICALMLIISVIINSGKETIFEMIILSVMIFSFQMIFVFNSKISKFGFDKEKESKL